MAESDLRKTFENIKLDPKVIENTLANPKVSASLAETIKEAGVQECDKKMGK